NDASGIFNPGISTIAWTGSDSWGNAATCLTTVTINQGPAVTIDDAYALSNGVDANTLYVGYAPAATLHVTATRYPQGYTYSWSAGTGLAVVSGNGNGPDLTIYATGTGDYSSTLSVTVTDDKDCNTTKAITIYVKNVRVPNKKDKVFICHNSHTLSVSANAVQAHLTHGDQLGSCSNSKRQDLYVLLTCLLSNSPNPFHLATTIQYSIPLDCKVSIKIYNVFGQEITTLFDGDKKAGSYTVGFNSSKLTKGIYYCKVTALTSDQSTVQTIILLAQ
ncbi:MAG: T9SS type A sorting domain-containing protein, partial [Bacteroidota bacterium]|nr:T9SS type A sorting domain-containing protein [Bacteroidota bacterium]